MTDHTQLPASCKDYIDKHLAVQKAYEGAGGNMVRTLFSYMHILIYACFLQLQYVSGFIASCVSQFFAAVELLACRDA
jgi:hypothetical protein